MAVDPLEAVDWSELAREHWEAQPHPQAPSLTIGEYPIAVRLATALKQGMGHAEAPEAAAFWKQFQPIMAGGIGPDQFLDRLHKLEGLSQTFHGRPPTLDEIVTLPTEDPEKLRKYYANLPDRDYPHVPAGDMVARLFAAKQYANLTLNRDPTKGEAAFFFHAGLNGTGILQHYQLLLQDQATKGQQAGQQESSQLDMRKGDYIPPYGFGPGGVEGTPPEEPPPFSGFPGINVPVPADDKPPPQGPDYIPPGGYGPGGVEGPAPQTYEENPEVGPTA